MPGRGDAYGTAVYFESGALYEASFTCGRHPGNVKNSMSSTAIIESPAGTYPVSQRRPLGAILLAAALAIAPARADTVQARYDIYRKGEDRASAVRLCTFSQRQGYVLIQLPQGVRHELSPTGAQPGTYVDEKGRPAYRSSGLGKRGHIYRLSDKSIYVYWDSAGLPGTSAAPEPSSAVPLPRAEATPRVPFERALTLQGVTFRVPSPNTKAMNRLEIVPSGLETNNTSLTREVNGGVVGAEVADLHVDRSPEVYVASTGSGSHRSLLAYAVDDRNSLSETRLPRLAEDRKLGKGYMGHDEFAVVENTLVRRFPLAGAGDTDAEPTGKMC